MTDKMTNARYAVIPEWILDADISDRAVRLFGILDRFAGTNDGAWPSRSTLAKRLRNCSVPSVDRALAELEAIDAITVERRKRADGSFTSSLYRLWPTNMELPTTSLLRGHLVSPVRPPSLTSDESGGSNPTEGTTEKTSSSAEGETKEKVSRMEVLFTTAWEHYPRKAARKAALKAFSARLKEPGISPDDLLTATKNYAASRLGQEAQYTMLGQTFFGPNERWKDFVDSTTEQQASRQVVEAAKMEQVKRDSEAWEAELERRHEESVPMSEERKRSLRRQLTQIGA